MKTIWKHLTWTDFDESLKGESSSESRQEDFDSAHISLEETGFEVFASSFLLQLLHCLGLCSYKGTWSLAFERRLKFFRQLLYQSFASHAKELCKIRLSWTSCSAVGEKRESLNFRVYIAADDHWCCFCVGDLSILRDYRQIVHSTVLKFAFNPALNKPRQQKLDVHFWKENEVTERSHGKYGSFVTTPGTDSGRYKGVRSVWQELLYPPRDTENRFRQRGQLIRESEIACKTLAHRRTGYTDDCSTSEVQIADEQDGYLSADDLSQRGSFPEIENFARLEQGAMLIEPVKQPICWELEQSINDTNSTASTAHRKLVRPRPPPRVISNNAGVKDKVDLGGKSRQEKLQADQYSPNNKHAADVESAFLYSSEFSISPKAVHDSNGSSVHLVADYGNKASTKISDFLSRYKVGNILDQAAKEAEMKKELAKRDAFIVNLQRRLSNASKLAKPQLASDCEEQRALVNCRDGHTSIPRMESPEIENSNETSITKFLASPGVGGTHRSSQMIQKREADTRELEAGKASSNDCNDTVAAMTTDYTDFVR